MTNKRFVSIAEYQRMSGLSYQTIKAALERHELRGLRSESGHWKIDTAADGNADISALARQLDDQARMLAKLCRHLGVVQ